MEHIIWNREMECADRSTIKALQEERLRAQVAYAYDRVPHYKKKMDELGVKPKHIQTLKDVSLLPFTTKEDLRQNYPFDMLAVPLRDCVRLHASSGTTGNPTVVCYTRQDMDMWTECLARIICAAGATPDDVAQVSFGYGLFTGGFGLHYGLERVGLMVIPAASGNTERQFKLMRDFGSTVLIATPSYALYLGEYAKEHYIDMSKIKLRLGLFGGEGHTDAMRKEIEKGLHILDTENYGLSEVIGPGYSGECYLQNGMHIAEDNFYSEIIDPDTGSVLPLGEQGELVITSLTKQALPVLRYRTKDISSLTDEPCKCGRTSMRMTKCAGRTDDMLIIKGVNVFPSQIEEALVSMPEVGANYEIVVFNENHLDQLEVKVEVADPTLLDNYAALEKLADKVRQRIFTVLNIRVKVTLCEPFSLKRFEGKAQRVTDLRGQ